MTVDDTQLGVWLESLGVRVRRRRDGSLHTLDFTAVPQAATEEVAARLPEAPRIKVLLTPGGAIGNTGAAFLARLPELAELDLRRTQIGDEGLASLKSLVNLKVLQLSGAPVTRDGVKALRQSLLNCRIVFLD